MALPIRTRLSFPLSQFLPSGCFHKPLYFFFKSLIDFITILLLFFFIFCCFGPEGEACGIFDPWSGIEPESPALKDKGPTTGPPGKSLR